MRKIVMFAVLFACGCSSTKEYTTRCNFNVPVNKPLDNSTITVAVTVNGRY